MNRRPKGQRPRGRNRESEETTGGVRDRVCSTASPEPGDPDQDQASPSITEWTGASSLGGQDPDQESVSMNPQTPAVGYASYKEQDGIIEDVEYDEEWEAELGHRGSTSPGEVKGAVGGVDRRGQERETEEQLQKSRTKPGKGRPAQCKTGKQGKKAQIYNPSLFPLNGDPVAVLGTQSESAISRQEITSGQRLFYGANIGSETRNVEFKKGGGDYLRSTFRHHLRRYACAFLNSGGGSLLVGVDDDGVVRGLHCSHRQEDQARLLVDSVLKGFQPPLLPHSYSLLFLPVVRPGPEGRELKVLRLTLWPPPALSQRGLYQTDQGDVYLRRDGSVEGPLSAGAIQEWARQRWSGELSRMQHCVEALLGELRLLLREIHLQSRTIAALRGSLTRGEALGRTPSTGGLGARLKQRFGKADSRTPSSADVSLSPALSSSCVWLEPPASGCPGRGRGSPWCGQRQGPTQCQRAGMDQEDMVVSGICQLM